MNPDKELTIFDKIEIAKAISQFPSMSIMAVTRQRVGLNMVKPMTMGIMAVMLFTVAYLAHSTGLEFYAVIMWLCGKWQHRNRWRDISRGKLWHGYSQGISWLEYLPLPDFAIKNELIYRFFDPLITFGIGFLVFPIDHCLGIWIAFCGLCLRIYTEAIWERTIDRLIIQMNGIIEAQAAHNLHEHFAKGNTEPLLHKNEESLGTPASGGDDIKDAIHKLEMESKLRDEQARRAVAEAVDSMHGATKTEPSIFVIDNSQQVNATVVNVNEETVILHEAEPPETEFVIVEEAPFSQHEIVQGELLPPSTDTVEGDDSE